MKKTLLLFAALFAGIGLTTAQTLTIPDVYVVQGGTASFGLVVDVPANSYAGFQFETTLPTGITYTEETTVSSDWDGTFQTSAVNFKGSASSGKLTPIPAGEIVIATAEIEADASLDPGTYNVTISNFEFLGYSGGAEDKKIADVTFHVIVTDQLVLDENSVAAPSATTDKVDVLVKRTIKANEWSSICFPFAMTADELKAAFGDGYDLEEFTGYEAEKDAANKVVGLKLNFTKNTKAAKINTPYIIKTSKDISEFEVNKKIAPGSTKKSITIMDDDTGEDVEIASMTGTYQAGTIVPKNSIFLSGNKFYYSTGNTKMKGFRAYFTLNDVLADVASAGASIFISFDGETTGIENIQRTVGDDRYYNLNGQHVENLKKGQIYIKNNKKVVVK